MPYIDITGQKFNRLVAQEYVGKNKYGRALWKCQCDCGNITVVDITTLKTGKAKSCGCYRQEKLTQNGDKHKTHGMSKTRLYRIWAGMIQRCRSDKYYKLISVCEEWKKFEPFYEWSMANGYKSTLSIDRIDNSGDYEPSNCRWVTFKAQQNNTSRNHYITYCGKTKSMKAWLDILGVKDKESFRYWRKKGLSDVEIIEHFAKKRGIVNGCN